MLDHVDGRAAAIEAPLAGLEDLALSTENYAALQQLDVFRALLALARGEVAEAERRLALTTAPPEQGILAFLPTAAAHPRPGAPGARRRRGRGAGARRG